MQISEKAKAGWSNAAKKRPEKFNKRIALYGIMPEKSRNPGNKKTG
jgi:hypothetical protein